MSVELRSVSKEYDLKTMGLTDVSLTFPRGSLTTIAGMAGCGKTTLLLCIGGLLDVTSGELLIGGKRMNDAPVRVRDVCLMREGLLPCRGSVRDNISYGLRLRGVARSIVDERTLEAAELAGLTDKLNVKASKLSDADRRRVGIARIVARRAAVNLLDEPLFNLPSEDRLPLADCIKRAHAALSSTFIAATSNGEDAFLLGGRVVVMRDGRVTGEGDEQSLTQSPPDMFTAAFLGENPMSFFTLNGKTVGVRRGDLVIAEDGDISAEVVGGSDGKLLVRINQDEPALTVTGELPQNATTVKLRLMRGAYFPRN